MMLCMPFTLYHKVNGGKFLFAFARRNRAHFKVI